MGRGASLSHGVLLFTCFIWVARVVAQESDHYIEQNPIVQGIQAQRKYAEMIRAGHIKDNYAIEHGIAQYAVRVHRNLSQGRWLDAGCGQCGVVEFLRANHIEAFGVEVNAAALEMYCHALVANNTVKQGSLAEIDFPDNFFDVVFSSEVLEHIPEQHIPKVVSELVRVSKGTLFMSISLRRAYADPKPPEPATIHITVKPRVWWHAQFEAAGCTVRHDVIHGFSGDVEAEPWVFAFLCPKRRDGGGDLPINMVGFWPRLL